MKKGDRIKVVDMVFSHENYPWIPDLVGKEGEIVELIEHTPIAKVPLEEPIFIVKMDEPFKTSSVPQGEHAFGYEPTEWEEETEFTFTGEEIEIVGE
jgi:hypothetical protein